MSFRQPVQEIIQARYSCRTYDPRPLDAEVQSRLSEDLAEGRSGPFGTRPRFRLAASSEQDPQALRELGTYGFIKGAPAFVISATRKAPGSMEDVGYLLERSVLYATELGLGTCWLGGTFTYSSFAQRIEAQEGEQIPAVISIGYAAQRPRIVDGIIRRAVGAHRRQPWQELFFEGDLTKPLTPESAGDYAAPLEMVRIAPSASNRQPWRVLQDGNQWHFYRRRSPAGRGWSTGQSRPNDSLQRMDLGIAMCHFEMTARDLDLGGHWAFEEPPVEGIQELAYTATWVAS